MKKVMIFICFLISVLCLSPTKNVVALESFQDFGLKQNVEPNKQWTIKFNKLVNNNSVSNDNIYIEDDKGRRVKSTFKVLNNNIIVKPCVDYERGKTYCLHVNNKIKSTGNKIIKKPIKMRFKIKDSKKSNVVIKGNEISISCDNDIPEAISIAIEKRIKELTLNLKNYNGDNDKVIEKIVYQLQEVLGGFVVYSKHDNNKYDFYLDYPYFIDNSYEDTVQFYECCVKLRASKKFMKIKDSQKVKIEAPKGTKIKFSSMDSSIASVDNEGNIVAKKEGVTKINVDVEVLEKDEEFDVEYTSNYQFSIPINVIGQDVIYINELEDISRLIENNLGKDSVRFFINNNSLKLNDIRKHQKRAEDKIKSILGSYSGISVEMNDDFTSLQYNNHCNMDNKELKIIYDSVENKATKILNSIIKPGMTEFEKEKAIHDYIVLNTAYDYNNYLNDTIPGESYTPYGVIVRGIGVCQGYAEAANYLLNRAGIESCVVYGSARNGETEGGHGWNIVKIDGKYYQLDVTWDDPVPDEKGKVEYNYFNLTDEEMAKNHTWDRKRYTKKCKSKRFMKMFKRKY